MELSFPATYHQESWLTINILPRNLHCSALLTWTLFNSREQDQLPHTFLKIPNMYCVLLLVHQILKWFKIWWTMKLSSAYNTRAAFSSKSRNLSKSFIKGRYRGIYTYSYANAVLVMNDEITYFFWYPLFAKDLFEFKRPFF